MRCRGVVEEDMGGLSPLPSCVLAWSQPLMKGGGPRVWARPRRGKDPAQGLSHKVHHHSTHTQPGLTHSSYDDDGGAASDRRGLAKSARGGRPALLMPSFIHSSNTSTRTHTTAATMRRRRPRPPPPPAAAAAPALLLLLLLLGLLPLATVSLNQVRLLHNSKPQPNTLSPPNHPPAHTTTEPHHPTSAPQQTQVPIHCHRHLPGGHLPSLQGPRPRRPLYELP